MGKKKSKKAGTLKGKFIVFDDVTKTAPLSNEKLDKVRNSLVGTFPNVTYDELTNEEMAAWVNTVVSARDAVGELYDVIKEGNWRNLYNVLNNLRPERVCGYCKNEVFCDSENHTDDTMTMVDGIWYHTNMCVPPKPKPVICVSCEKEQEADSWGEYDNLLGVQLEGGYGGFVDYFSRQEKDDYHFYLCHDCAHALCDELPWLNRIINPYSSHSHRYVNDKLPEGHWGWDYDRGWRRDDCDDCGALLHEPHREDVEH